MSEVFPTDGRPDAPLRIALLDPHELVCYGLRMRLEQESGWQVAGTYRRAEALVDALNTGMQCDLVTMNHVLDHGTGFGLVQFLVANHPSIRILICSECERSDAISRLFELGVNGFIGRTQSLDDHVQAVRRVAAGNTYFSARIAGGRTSRDGGTGLLRPRVDSIETAIGHPDLTNRERTVLEHFLGGMSLTQISIRVNRSYKTISSQKQSAYRKLGVRNDAELFAKLSGKDGQER